MFESLNKMLFTDISCFAKEFAMFASFNAVLVDCTTLLVCSYMIFSTTCAANVVESPGHRAYFPGFSSNVFVGCGIFAMSFTGIVSNGLFSGAISGESAFAWSCWGNIYCQMRSRRAVRLCYFRNRMIHHSRTKADRK